ncbi:GTPase IMAP family member 8 [Biomphalaria pfeifferi]|uniref:GTPase IMAP family member 8 n=1 Tax=Biomphalaria pfeifferi TaxID=112525 RepID=A0AAD8FJ98_BIOPF|nr:GTPase IMAP family member 8 [Biomphalaria pfeifferi]
MTVVDGPSFDPAVSNDSEKLQELFQHFQESLQLVPNGFDAILIVIRYGSKFTAEDVKTFEILKLALGNDVLKNYGIIVLTYGDTFLLEHPNEGYLQEWCFKQEGSLTVLGDDIKCNHVEEETAAQLHFVWSLNQTSRAKLMILLNEAEVVMCYLEPVKCTPFSKLTKIDWVSLLAKNLKCQSLSREEIHIYCFSKRILPSAACIMNYTDNKEKIKRILTRKILKKSRQLHSKDTFRNDTHLFASTCIFVKPASIATKDTFIALVTMFPNISGSQADKM